MEKGSDATNKQATALILSVVIVWCLRPHIRGKIDSWESRISSTTKINSFPANPADFLFYFLFNWIRHKTLRGYACLSEELEEKKSLPIPCTLRVFCFVFFWEGNEKGKK